MTISRNLADLANNVDTSGTLGVAGGGTGATSNATAPFALKGANSDITSITGLTTALAPSQGGTGLTALGTGIATFLGVPSSANLFSAMTDDTGTGLLTFNTTPTFVGLRETRIAIPASDINLSTGNFFTRTISGVTTLTVSNVPTTGTAASFILDLTNGGSATVNWWTGVKWAGGTPPTLTTAGRDSLGFYTYDGGTTWTGLLLGKDIK